MLYLIDYPELYESYDEYVTRVEGIFVENVNYKF